MWLKRSIKGAESPTEAPLFETLAISLAAPATAISIPFANLISKMKVIAAYLLLVLGGNTCPTAADIKGVLGSVGADADDDKIELLLSQLEGKDIAEVIAAGREKLASVPAGGGAVAVAAAAPASGGGAAAPAAEAKKEEKVEEKEESDDDMGFSLFD